MARGNMIMLHAAGAELIFQPTGSDWNGSVSEIRLSRLACGGLRVYTCEKKMKRSHYDGIKCFLKYKKDSILIFFLYVSR